MMKSYPLLELISNREAINLQRAERVVALNLILRIGVRCDAPHASLHSAYRQNKTISFQFFAAPPRPPTAGKEEGRKCFVFSGSLQSLQNDPLNKFYCLRNTIRRFSIPLRTWRFLIAFSGNSNVRLHYANTLHWSLTSFMMPARGCFVFV